MMGNQPQRSETVAEFVYLSVAPVYRASGALEVARALTELGLLDAAKLAIEVAQRLRRE